MIKENMADFDENTRDRHLKELVQLAYRLGASNAGLVSARDIRVEDNLAALCLKPRCEHYGLSPGCPPHVSGPAAFRRWLEKCSHAIAIRIVVPSSVLFSDERREVMQLLHEIVAGIEQAAVDRGYTDSKAFAGGSCKHIFCRAHADCRVLSENGSCRNPQSARPSMSGFGIHVAGLMALAGWPAETGSRNTAADPDPISWVAGLIVISETL